METARQAAAKLASRCAADSAALETEQAHMNTLLHEVLGAGPTVDFFETADGQTEFGPAPQGNQAASTEITGGQAEALTTALQARRAELDEQLQTHKARQNALQAEQQELAENQQKQLLLQKQLAEADKQLAQLEPQIRDLEAENTRLETAGNALAERLEYPSPAEAETALNTAKAQLLAARQALEAAQQAAEAAARQAAAAQALLEERQRRGQATSQKAQQAAAAFAAALKAEDFADETEYRRYAAGENELEQARQKLEDHRTQLGALQRDIQRLEQEIGEGAPADLAALENEQQALDETLAGANTAHARLHGLVTANQQARHELAHLAEGRAEKEQQYALAKALADTATGQLAGKDKITFEAYIQSAYYARVLGAANRRLEGMTDGRYQLARRASAQDKRSKTGLELEVADCWNGHRRDVRTLSGGESFQAALALALGLSDVVQQTAGGVKLDAMFIDEGFGSLDPEALDAAIDTLQGLAGGGRVVGIISHVGELAARIDKQIQVIQGQDTSRIRIVE